jgi:AcrR family transcriptional regulator
VAAGTAGARRGRRRGSPDTRAAILAAARDSFAQKGFGGTTIRAVAGGAGVDPALVHHYFGAKEDLFLAALELPVDPREVLAGVVAAGPDGAGERLVRTFLSVWDDPELRLPLLAVARSALGPDGHRLLTEGFLPVLIGPVLRGLVPDRAEDRIPLVLSQVLGLVMARYVLEVEPLASWPAEVVAARVGPSVQRYLTGDLP